MARKLLRFLIWSLIALIGFVVLFYIEEDWRGARDWAACQNELRARGEILALRQLVPPGKPEDDLSKVPIFAEAYTQPRPRLEDILKQIQKQLNQEKDTRKLTRLEELDINLHDDSSVSSPKSSSYLAGQSLDLAAWQTYYRAIPEGHLTETGGTPAKDVLHVLSRFDPQMQEIEEAFRNPDAYFPINYERPNEGSLAPITGMIGVAKVLHLKAIAHLDNHEFDLAEQDYLFSIRIKRALAMNCCVINFLIIAGVQAVDNGILWQGLHMHAWIDTQLREMEFDLGSSDMLEIATKALRTERASTLQMMELTQAGDPEIHRVMKPYSGDGLWYFFQSRPNGWWDQDRLHWSFMMQKQIDAINPGRGTLTKLQDDAPSGQLAMVYIPLTESLRSATHGYGNVIARAETYQRFARLACRLEEFRIAQGHYPEKLEELPDLPAHLNQEVLSEQPLRYRRNGAGYALYSIGWNEKDDGGVSSTDPREGDWVWPSP